LRVDDPAVERNLDRLQVMRLTAGANDADMRIARPTLLVFIVVEGNAGQREIALTPRKFLETPAAAYRPGRQEQFGADFVEV
jgi:hypothetical protein